MIAPECQLKGLTLCVCDVICETEKLIRISPSRIRSRNLLRSYSEEPPTTTAARRQQGHSSHTSLEAYAEVPSGSTGLTMQLPHSTSLQDNSSVAEAAHFQHYPTHSFPRQQQHRRNLSWQHGRSRCAAILSQPHRHITDMCFNIPNLQTFRRKAYFRPKIRVII